MDKQVEGTESGNFDGKSKDDEKATTLMVSKPGSGKSQQCSPYKKRSLRAAELHSAASEQLTWTRSSSLPLPGSRHGLSAGG